MAGFKFNTDGTCILLLAYHIFFHDKGLQEGDISISEASKRSDKDHNDH